MFLHFPTCHCLFFSNLSLSLLFQLVIASSSNRFAVHSLKDMPTRLPDGLTLAAISERADERDCVVVHARYRGKGIRSIPELIECKRGVASSENLQEEADGATQPGPTESAGPSRAALIIGSSSIRREALLRSKYAGDIEVKTIRGNVQTRLGA